MFRISRLLPLALAAAWVTGCGSDTSTTPTPVQGSVALSISPTNATIQQGGSTQVTGTIARTNFTGDVAIAVSGAPAGVTGNVTLAPTGGTNTAQVTIAAATNTPVGTYPLVLTARGSGIDSATATFTLTVSAATPASFTFTLGTPSQSIAQGGNGSSTITITRAAFTGAVNLTAENLPTGVTAVFSSNPAAGATSSVTFTATNTAAPGTFNAILIRGTSAGLTDVTAPVALTLTVAGNFAIAATNPTLTLVQGSSTTTTVNATRTGAFSGTLVYSVTGPANAALPAGLTATVTPTATADQNTLTITTAASLAAGTYPIVVHATAFGVEQTANASVVVTPQGAAIRLDYSACPAASKPLWVAFQDGTGAFTRVTSTNDIYTFTIFNSKGAYAVVMPDFIRFATAVNYFAASEAPSIVGTCTSTPTKINTGTVAGITAGQQAIVSLGGALAARTSNGAITLSGIASGNQDLVAYRRTVSQPNPANDRAIVRRSVNIADGGSIPALDFTNVAEVLQPISSTFTVSGAVGGRTVSMDQQLLTGASCSVHELHNSSATSSTIPVFGLPVAALVASDFYLTNVTEESDGTTASRSILTTYHTLADRNVTLPPAIAATATITTSALNSYRLMQSVATVPAGYQTAVFTYTDAVAALRAGLRSQANSGGSYTITQSAGYLAGATTTTLAAVDFGAVAGFNVAWGPLKGSAIAYNTSAFASTGSCTEGATTKSSTLYGFIPLN